MMRRFVVTTVVAVVLSGAVAACGASSKSGTSTGTTASRCSKSGIQRLLYTKGVLTVATDNPAYPPWFENNTPSNGKGYESTVAYDVAAQLGFSRSKVVWVHESFNSSYGPGPKAFDFDINEVSYTSQRAQAVTFSNSYYPVQQSIIALKGNPIVTKHSPAQLKTYLYGDEIDTTGLAYINSDIQPTQTPKVFSTLNLAVAALEAHRVDALIVDTPDAQYMAAQQVPHGILVGQFPTVDHFGLVFAKGNPLVTCVNKALATLTDNGTLAALQKQYLGIFSHFLVIQP
jgi:polar amino acid transport system substrate-binding protein